MAQLFQPIQKKKKKNLQNPLLPKQCSIVIRVYWMSGLPIQISFCNKACVCMFVCAQVWEQKSWQDGQCGAHGWCKGWALSSLPMWVTSSCLLMRISLFTVRLWLNHKQQNNKTDSSQLSTTAKAICFCLLTGARYTTVLYFSFLNTRQMWLYCKSQNFECGENVSFNNDEPSLNNCIISGTHEKTRSNSLKYIFKKT